MIQIPLSRIISRENFAAAVVAHRDAIQKQMLGKPGIMAPVAHELIESCVLRIPDGGPVADRGPDRIEIVEYEFLDDLPAPPSIEQLKVQYIGQVQTAAMDAKKSVLSPARAQLLSIDASAAMAIPEADRTPLQQEAIEGFQHFHRRCGEIDRAAAIAAIAVEELTDLTILGWNPPTF